MAPFVQSESVHHDDCQFFLSRLRCNGELVEAKINDKRQEKNEENDEKNYQLFSFTGEWMAFAKKNALQKASGTLHSDTFVN